MIKSGKGKDDTVVKTELDSKLFKKTIAITRVKIPVHKITMVVKTLQLYQLQTLKGVKQTEKIPGDKQHKYLAFKRIDRKNKGLRKLEMHHGCQAYDIEVELGYENFSLKEAFVAVMAQAN